MYIEAVPNRSSPPAILLRESYRDGNRVRKRTLLNLTDWPRELVEGLRALLKGGTVIPAGQAALSVIRWLPHGHVAAVLGTLRKIGLDRLLGPAGERGRELAIALIVSRILAPTSKLATAKALAPATAASSLGAVLGLGEVAEDELYAALDGLLARQPAIETALARRHLRGGTLVLYDVSSSYLEGRCCALARLGDHRDGKKGKLQIVYGLLCAADGCPVAIEVFAGDVADPKTLATQVGKLKQRFDLSHVVLVGAKSPGSWGLITQARIDEDLRPAGLDWISALRAPAIKAPAIKALVDGGALQLSLFDERDLAAITAPARLAPKGDLRWSPWSAAPGERLIVGRNPDLARERTRKRAALLAATERDLTAIAAAVTRPRRPLRGAAAIGLEVGVVLDRHKMAKHFELTITDDRFSFARRTAAIAAEAALDGLYVVRTSLPAERLDDRRDRARLQVARGRRTRVPLPEDGRSPDPPDLPLAGNAGACPRLPVHARLPCRMAPARPSGTHALRRRRQAGGRRGPRQHRRQGRALARGARQADHRPYRRRPAGAQLPKPARRSRHAQPQQRGQRARARAPVHPDHPPDPDPAEGLRPPRPHPRPYPVTTPARRPISRQIKPLRPIQKGSSD